MAQKFTLEQWNKAKFALQVSTQRKLPIVEGSITETDGSIRLSVIGLEADKPNAEGSAYANLQDRVFLTPILDDTEEPEVVVEEMEASLFDDATEEIVIGGEDNPLLELWISVGLDESNFQTQFDSIGEEGVKSVIQAMELLSNKSSSSETELQEAKDAKTKWNEVTFITYFRRGEYVPMVDFLTHKGIVDLDNDDDEASITTAKVKEAFDAVADLVKATQHFEHSRKLKDETVNDRLPDALDEMFRRLSSILPNLVKLGLMEDNWQITNK